MSVERLPSGSYRAKVMINRKLYTKVFNTKEEAALYEEQLKILKKTRIGKNSSTADFAQLSQAIENLYSITHNSDIGAKYKPIFRSQFKSLRIEDDIEKELNKIDGMTGRYFELYCTSLFQLTGYLNGGTVEVTPENKDFGADVIINCINGYKVTVQCKRFNSYIGIKAVQQVVASRMKYQANAGAVITNNFFTPSAIELADDNNIWLLDRYALIKLIELKNKYLEKIRLGNQWGDLMGALMQIQDKEINNNDQE